MHWDFFQKTNQNEGKGKDMAKKIGPKEPPQNGKGVRGIATTAEILYSFSPRSPTPNRSFVVAFGGDLDAAQTRQLDSAHYGEYLT